MDYEADLPLEEIDRRLRSLGYEPFKNYAGCFYSDGTFQVEVVADKGKFIISYPNMVNGVLHPLVSQAKHFSKVP